MSQVTNPAAASFSGTNLPPNVSLAGKKVLVMGLGRFGGGVGVSRWLASQGAKVTVTDAAPEKDLADSLNALAGLPIRFKLGGHDVADFLAADLLVINPAVDKKTSDVVQAALCKQGGAVPYTTEMNLFLERCRGTTIGITGSVGKSTTTALIFEALKAGLSSWPSAQGRPPQVYLGGNIGRSLLPDLPSIRPQDLVVLELSSFMLEETPRIRWSPHIAVVTNIFPNHLDRHGTLAAYTAAKQNILRFQRPDDVAVLNNDHQLVSRWPHLAKGKVITFTTRGPASRKLTLTIPGEHNQSNAAAALAVLDALPLPLDRPAVLAAIQQFPGLPHRLECVHTWQIPAFNAGAPARRVRFFNDSKATTPDASITAVEAFPPRSALFIVGGYDKHIDLSSFEELLAGRAAAVIGIGQTGQPIVDHVQQLARTSPPLTTYAGSLANAVEVARRWASTADSPVESVVLSPASASWDQFPNYEKRGEEFAALARQNPVA